MKFSILVRTWTAYRSESWINRKIQCEHTVEWTFKPTSSYKNRSIKI